MSNTYNGHTYKESKVRQRDDHLTLSIGRSAGDFRPTLSRLALEVTGPGRQGLGSISELVTSLAEWGAQRPQETAHLLLAIKLICGGGDEWDLLRHLQPLLPPIEITARLLESPPDEPANSQ
jgi:hypothetical protein